MPQVRPNITMQQELWERLLAHVAELQEEKPEVSASSIIRELVRDYLEVNAKKKGRRK
jgi:hypothetical protein